MDAKRTSWTDVFKLKESAKIKSLESYFPTGIGPSGPNKLPPSGNLNPKKQPQGPSQGFDTKSWFYAAKPPNEPSHPVNQPQPAPKEDVAAVVVEITPEDEARQIIMDNPEISAATLLNTLKAKGFILVKDLPVNAEADSASSNAGVLRPGVKDEPKEKQSPHGKPHNDPGLQPSKTSPLTKESAPPKKSKMMEFNAKLKETINDGVGPTRFEVVLLEEGLGNLKDAFYYTREAIESGITLFEGKKLYADHPDSISEQTRPERSIRDIGGHYEKVRVAEDKDGRALLMADAVVLPDPSYDWVRGLMRRAAVLGSQFPDKQFIGLSINANGEAEEMPMEQFLKENDIPPSALVKLKTAMEAGVSTIRPVHKLTDAVSCDLVTEPGAGGKVIKMLD